MKALNPAALALAALIVLAGCSGGETASASPEQKKAFSGGPPPADYMSGIKTAPPAQKAPPGQKP